MATTHDARGKIEKIDEEIIHLLSERAILTQHVQEDDEEAIGTEYQADTLAFWEGAADERGWNMTTMARICRGILDLCKHPEE